MTEDTIHPYKDHIHAPSNAPQESQIIALPHDITTLLITEYLHDDLTALSSLSMTCHLLNDHCRPQVFRTVVVGFKALAVHGKVDHPHSSMKLAQLVAILRQSPDIAELIQDLRVFQSGLAHNPGLRSALHVDDGQDLEFLFTRPMRNLRRLELFLHLHWGRIATTVQDSYREVFSLPNLCEVHLDTLGIPTTHLAHLPVNLGTLRIRGSISRPAEYQDKEEDPPKVIEPRHVIVQARRLHIDIIRGLDHFSSPVRFTSLQSFEYFGNGGDLNVVSEMVGKQGSSSITRLRLAVNAWSVGMIWLPSLLLNPHIERFSTVPDYFDASLFQPLKILELGMQCGDPSSSSREPLLRFLWISDTLKTLPDDTLIETIALTIDFDMSLSPHVPDIPWDTLDNLFSPQERAKGRFGHLKRVTLLACSHLPMEDVENRHPQVHEAHTLWIREVKNHLQHLSLLGVLETRFISFDASILDM